MCYLAKSGHAESKLSLWLRNNVFLIILQRYYDNAENVTDDSDQGASVTMVTSQSLKVDQKTAWMVQEDMWRSFSWKGGVACLWDMKDTRRIQRRVIWDTPAVSPCEVCDLGRSHNVTTNAGGNHGAVLWPGLSHWSRQGWSMSFSAGERSGATHTHTHDEVITPRSLDFLFKEPIFVDLGRCVNYEHKTKGRKWTFFKIKKHAPLILWHAPCPAHSFFFSSECPTLYTCCDFQCVTWERNKDFKKHSF